jgi:chromosome segregation ATPase
VDGKGDSTKQWLSQLQLGGRSAFLTRAQQLQLVQQQALHTDDVARANEQVTELKVDVMVAKAETQRLHVFHTDADWAGKVKNATEDREQLLGRVRMLQAELEHYQSLCEHISEGHAACHDRIELRRVRAERAEDAHYGCASLIQTWRRQWEAISSQHLGCEANLARTRSQLTTERAKREAGDAQLDELSRRFADISEECRSLRTEHKALVMTLDLRVQELAQCEEMISKLKAEKLGEQEESITELGVHTLQHQLITLRQDKFEIDKQLAAKCLILEHMRLAYTQAKTEAATYAQVCLKCR